MPLGCHHGERASPITLRDLEGDLRALGRGDWVQARGSLAGAIGEVLEVDKPPTKLNLSGPDFMLLSGLTSFTDWIGSNEDFFPFGTPRDCENLFGWFQKRRSNANVALDAIGWQYRIALSQKQKSFEDVFSLSPRPLQQAVVDSLVDFEKAKPSY